MIEYLEIKVPVVSSKVTSLAINLSKSSIIVRVGIVNFIEGRSVVGVELLLREDGFKAMNILVILSSYSLNFSMRVKKHTCTHTMAPLEKRKTPNTYCYYWFFLSVFNYLDIY